MKLIPALFVFSATVIAPLSAQTPTTAKPAAKPAGSTTPRPATVSTCAKVPELSPKIPTLDAGVPCARHLYTITTIPTVKLENVSPFEGPNLKEDLAIEAVSFSLDYIETKVGTGALAGRHAWYTINYTGYLLDGTKFDSSIDRGEPITIPYGQHQVIPGWDTGFAGMRVGGKRRLFIPFQLAYGANPPQQSHIPAKSELVFDVELVSISETPPPAKPKPAPPTPPAGAQPGVQPAPAAPPPGSPTKPTPPPANPANPATVPPPTDPTKPTTVPPPASTTPPQL